MIGLFKIPLISKIALLIKSFKSRVAADGGTFEAESCLKTTLTQLNNANVLQQASLVITPNAVKAGKLDSVIPNNGAGDLNVVRATSATRVNSAGLIEIVGNNIARIDYSNGSCPSILVEPQMTNIWTYNNNTNGYASNLSAIKQSVVSNVFGTGIDGFQYNFIGGETFISSNYNIRIFDTRNLPIQRLSLFIKNPSSDFFCINFSFVEEVIFKFSTLEVSNPNNAYIKKINSNTYILYLYTNVATGAQYSQVRVGFVQSLSSRATINGSCILGLGFAQGLASGSLPNYDYLPIITNTGSVTRNADVISKAGISNLIGQTEGTLYWEGSLSTNIMTIASLRTDSGSLNGVILDIQPDNRIRAYIVENNVQKNSISSLSAITLNSFIKIAYVYKSGNCSLFINGVKQNTSSQAFAFNNTISRVNIDYVGYNYGGLQGKIKYVKNCTVFPTILTDAQCISLTTL